MMASVTDIVNDVAPARSAVDDIRAEAHRTPPYEGGKPAGRVLRALREHAGIESQAEFSELAKWSTQTIARHEDGQTADPVFMDDPWVRQVLAVLLRRAGLGSLA